jgi:hypothetical protein
MMLRTSRLWHPVYLVQFRCSFLSLLYDATRRNSCFSHAYCFPCSLDCFTAQRAGFGGGDTFYSLGLAAHLRQDPSKKPATTRREHRSNYRSSAYCRCSQGPMALCDTRPQLHRETRYEGALSHVRLSPQSFPQSFEEPKLFLRTNFRRKGIMGVPIWKNTRFTFASYEVYAQCIDWGIRFFFLQQGPWADHLGPLGLSEVMGG